MAKEYPYFKRALMGLHGLTEEETKVFFSLCNKKVFCVKEVMQVLVSVKANKKSRSTAYNIVEKLQNAELITLINGSNKKQEYNCIHPRAIINSLKIALEKANKELPELETAYETSDFKGEDPRETLRILKSENDIASTCYGLKDYELTIIHDKSMPIKGFIDRIKDCGKVLTGGTNVILFNKKEKNTWGVIEISKRIEKGSNIRLWGVIKFDEELCKYYLKKEVKK